MTVRDPHHWQVLAARALIYLHPQTIAHMLALQSLLFGMAIIANLVSPSWLAFVNVVGALERFLPPLLWGLAAIALAVTLELVKRATPRALVFALTAMFWLFATITVIVVWPSPTPALGLMIANVLAAFAGHLRVRVWQ